MIKVTAAVIRDGEKVLICRRPKGKNHSGMWEFPGGKVEPGENLFDCIIRECQEELCIMLEPVRVITVIQNGEHEITFLECVILDGDITLLEHEALMWINKNDADSVDLCPGDRLALGAIFAE